MVIFLPEIAIGVEEEKRQNRDLAWQPRVVCSWDSGVDGIDTGRLLARWSSVTCAPCGRIAKA